MSSNMERVAAMPDASLYVNRDGRRADDCVDSHGGGNLTKIPRSGGHSQNSQSSGFQLFQRVGNPIFASYLGHLPTYLLFLVDFLRKTNLPT